MSSGTWGKTDSSTITNQRSVSSTICSRNLDSSWHWHQSSWSVRDSCCRSVGNSSSEMMRLQRLPACRRSWKSSATIIAPSSVMSRDHNKMSRRTRASTVTSTCLSADHPTTSGNAAWADPESDGSTRFGRTTEFPRRTCGGVVT